MCKRPCGIIVSNHDNVAVFGLDSQTSERKVDTAQHGGKGAWHCWLAIGFSSGRFGFSTRPCTAQYNGTLKSAQTHFSAIGFLFGNECFTESTCSWSS